MKEIINAIKQICEEKNLEYDAVIDTIESALAAAYRKDFGKKNQNIKVEFNNEDISKSKIFDSKIVVEDMPEEEKLEEAVEEEKKDIKVAKKSEKAKEKTEQKKEIKEVLKNAETVEEERKFNPKTEIQLSDAKLIKKTAKPGDEIQVKLKTPPSYGRMAAQTAKQVIIQKLREAEREMIFNEFKDKENEVVGGVVQRQEGRVVLVDLGKSTGVLLSDEQIPGESYRPGERIKVFIREVALKPRGPEILLSRTSEEILKKVFLLEIPEISNGLIELKAVAREAGARSKVAVWTDSNNVDPIGSCVGQRGARIQTIIAELGGEKVDIIEYDDEPTVFISNALSPAKILSVDIDEDSKKARVNVNEDQLSLAIGKNGQNARLAAKLTGWNIDIVKAGEEKDIENKGEKEVEDDKKKTDEKKTENKEEKEDKKKDFREKKEDKEEKKDKKKNAKQREKDQEEKSDAKDKKKKD